MGGPGGALYCQSDSAATNCTFSGNQAGNAGSSGGLVFDPSNNGQPTGTGSDGGQGGGIFCAGPLALYGCTIGGNRGGDASSAEAGGGGSSQALAGISVPAAAVNSTNQTGSPRIIIYTWIGHAGGAGGTGGIYTENRLNMMLCTVSGNVAGIGGAGGNSEGGYMEYFYGGDGGAGGSGGLYCVGTNALELVACTITANRGASGAAGGQGQPPPDGTGHTGQGAGGNGGVGGIINATAAPARLINTLVAANLGGAGGPGGPYAGSSGNAGASDLQGPFTSLGHNLIGQADGSSGITNGLKADLAGSANAPLAPMLGPLANNGGSAATSALLNGSPALNAGDDALLQSPYCIKADQRGFARKSGAHVDIGAFESQPPAASVLADPPILSATPTPNQSQTAPVNPRSAMPAAPVFGFTFTNHTPGATFTVLATTNLSLPFATWSVLGQAVEQFPGVFQFTDLSMTNAPQRFYRVSSP
jgi:hypothetical protein